MARLWKHDEQIDPFNAGEPALPWDDPSTAHETEGEDCAFSDEPYDGPTKKRDHYDAPSNRASKSKPSRKRSSSNSSPVDNLHDLFGEVLDSMTDEGDSGDAPSPYEVGAHTAKSRATNKAVKQGKKKKSTALTVIKWVFFAIILTNLIPILIGASSILIEDIFGPDEAYEYVYDGPDESNFSDDDTEEKACRDALNSAFDRTVMSDGLAYPMLVQSLNESLMNDLGYTPEELGIDPNTYASWFLAYLDFDISSVYVYDDGTASAYFDAWGPKDYDVQSKALDVIYEYLDAEGLLSSGEPTPLSPTQQAAVNELFNHVLDEAVTDDNSFLSIELERVDGTWTIDEDELAEELTYALGL